MIILYRNRKAEEQFSSAYKKKWRYPERVKVKLEAAENFIRNAGSMSDIANYRPFHLERLSGSRHDEWSIRVGNTGYRITFIPCNGDREEITDGDILSICTGIKIVKVTEVSNHYE